MRHKSSEALGVPVRLHSGQLVAIFPQERCLGESLQFLLQVPRLQIVNNCDVYNAIFTLELVTVFCHVEVGSCSLSQDALEEIFIIFVGRTDAELGGES